jgi:hypothetical protein
MFTALSELCSILTKLTASSIALLPIVKCAKLMTWPSVSNAKMACTSIKESVFLFALKNSKWTMPATAAKR